MMSSQLTRKENILIKEIAYSEGINDCKLKVSSASVKGDGYIGTISSIDIISQDKKLSLILKAAERNEEARQAVPVRRTYLREIYIYNTLFPEFQKFQRKYSEDIFSAFAKIYGSNDEDCNECLVFENLKKSGFKMWNRQLPMNTEHVELVFTEYGKFHAVSLAMRDKDPQKFHELTRDLDDIWVGLETTEEIKKSVKVTLDNGFKAVEGDKSANKALQRFSEMATSFLLEDIHEPEDNIVVIHGDSWSNNMMFKYEDIQNPKMPTKMCLIDWQIAKIGSPVLDLTYFLSICCSREILDDYERYLKIYYKTVSENLRTLSCDPEEIFPYSLLDRHWKKYAKFGLFIVIMMIKFMLFEEDEVPKNLVEAEKFLYLNTESIHSNDCSNRISDFAKFLAKNELI